ncbi:ABC transporter permease [Lysobacter sp. A6]|uniref:ABC transporter permease n=1 Tax=Noviluteimonas lactosilytica TaxID=2888523 RepID=A0ABS8JHI6_9GAMM|nr:ABC transporter permease [Lysobacter lactosilyticus]MCC8363076.1 ABC transporter permease [Lysobacter lactosilyticus]
MKSMHSIRTIVMKELLEFVRDRRTLMLALVLGPLLTPAIMLGILTLAETRAKSQIEKPLEVPMVGVERAPNLVAWLAGQGIHRKQFDGDLDTAIRTQVEDVYLRIGDDFSKDWHAGSPALVEIVHDSTRQDSEIPVRRIEAALTQYGSQVGALRLLARGMNPSVGAPLAVAHKDLSTPEARRGMVMAFLPYLLILSAFIGGAYLIIDTTAGERERQSLEPLLATPAHRGAVVTGKIAAACAVGATSLLLTLIAFKIGAAFSPGIGRNMDVSLPAVGKMLLILLPMLFIGTSLLTFIAAGAKSVKEAQSYMSVLMLLPMIPTIALMVSPVKNQLWMFTVPFLAQNQMLLKVVRGEGIEPMQWVVYLVAGFGLALVLWLAATRRYHQERLAISA